MIKIKKFRLLIAFISLLMCLTFIQDTYAKYVNNVNGEANLTIARWKILVNNEDITTGSLAQEVITPVFSGTDYIKSDVIAPTSTGYFDIIIDAKDTDVSFNYTITVNTSSESSVTDLVTTGYSINDGEVINFENYNENITGTIDYNTIDITTIRVYVMWNDSDSNNMDNNADTIAATTEESKALLNVSLSFIQNKGE
ncbi:MAG: hypothetical protein PUC23_03145 [bacterium]|nr:hypothetical protein [bacterium]